MLNLPLGFVQRPTPASVQRPWLLVLMHGVGSHEHDLMGLAPLIPEDFYVISLRAPVLLGPDSHAWFQFSVAPDGQRLIHEVQEAESRQLLAQTIRLAQAQLGIPADRVVVGGFSQGGIMALSMLLTQPELLRAAVVWHGRLLVQVVPQVAPPSALQGKHLWVSHGTHDLVIPISHAQAICQFVEDLPVSLSYQEFPGMHEIRQAELAATVEWLQALVASSSSAC